MREMLFSAMAGQVEEDLEQLDTRDLLRRMRRLSQSGSSPEGMPEAALWRLFLELRRRGDGNAGALFIESLRTLHRRRGLRTAELPTRDPDPDDHRLAGDVFLGELWRAYKRCIQQSRTGPAAQLLRDLEVQVGQL